MKDIIFKTLMLKGEAGSTIVSMERTGHSGTTDTYTITFDDGSTTDIQIENLSSVESIELTSQTDTEDTYTATLADGSTQSFSVLNHNADIEAISEELAAGLASIASDLAEQSELLNARMDTFTSLPSGSTAGDAELTDIRVGEDGKKYGSAGTAVRKQISCLKNGFNKIDLELYGGNANVKGQFCDGYYSNSAYVGNGNVVVPPFAGWNVLLLNVKKGKSISINGVPTTNGAYSAWLNSSTLSDINTIAWASNANFGERICVTDWLAISAYQMDPENITITYIEDGLEKEISDTKDVLSIAVDSNMQLLKESNHISGHFYDISSSAVRMWTNANLSCYGAIPIKKDITYYFRGLYAYFCLIDINGTVTRLSATTGTAENGSFTPSDDGYIYVSLHDGVSTTKILTNGRIFGKVDENTTLYGVHLNIDKYVHLSIKSDGTGDYSSPVAAVRDIKDSSEQKQYMLDIYEGVYYLWPDLGEIEKQGSIWGLTLPDYVHLRGIGNRDSIWLACRNETPDNAYEVEYTSCINLKQNNSLENISFSGKNIRYVVHDESSNTYKDWHKKVKNCRFVHYGNDEGYWTYTNAWGEGCSSGSYSEFEDCIFENYSYVAPFAFHTNTDFESACTHIFKNCQFIQHYIGNDSTGAFMIDDIQCGQPINVEFIGCSFSRFIFVQNHNSATDIAELNITGHANSPVYLHTYRPNVASPKKLFTKFSDEVAMVYNPYDAITAGRPLRYTSYKDNNVGIVQSDGVQCAGIALDTIPSQGIGYMKYAGILDLSTVGVSGINIGDKVGVASWSVAKVTDGTEFARAIQNNVIKFL